MVCQSSGTRQFQKGFGGRYRVLPADMYFEELKNIMMPRMIHISVIVWAV